MTEQTTACHFGKLWKTSVRMMRIFFSICLAFQLVSRVNGQEKFVCPTTRFFADVAGLSIRCYQYPDDQSTLAFCFKDLWWKYFVFRTYAGKPVFDPNPFNLLDLDVCRSKCGCKLYFSFITFRCMPRGLSPAWTKTDPTKLRGACNCRDLRLPQELEKNADHILVSVSLQDVPPRAGDSLMIRDLVKALSQLRVRDVEIMFTHTRELVATDVTTAIVSAADISAFRTWPQVTSLDDDFFVNDTFRDMVGLSLFVNGVPRQLTWALMETAFKQITSQLTILAINDFNITSIPKYPFSKNLRCLVCRRCYSLVEAPTWLGESPNMLYLHIANAANFRLNDLPPSASLLYFSFSDTNYGSLPNGWNPSKLYPNLENLDLSYLNLSVISSDLLKNLTHLLRLDLSGNCLSPLPSFQGLTKLVLLDLNSITLILGTPTPMINNDIFRSSGKCVYGRCPSLRLRRSDLDDLTSLQYLSVSYYRDLRIDDDAFASLSKLKSLQIVCANQSRLPVTLKYTCQLQQLTAISNPFGVGIDGDRLDSDPAFWSIPLFIPKFYKKLTMFDIRLGNINNLPPSLLAFNVSKAATVVGWLSYSMANNPLSKNQCELRKFEKAFRLMSTMPASFANQTAVCDQKFEASMSIVQRKLENFTNYCLQSAAIDLHPTRIGLSLISGLMIVIFWQF